jgi:hypothetical protein
LAFALGRDSGEPNHREPTVYLGGKGYPGASLRASVSTLCTVATTARKDVKASYDLFINKAHQDLHVIAASAQKIDRRVSGRMLVAMEVLEASFAHSDPGAIVAAEARTLVRRSDAALRLVKITPVTCGA